MPVDPEKLREHLNDYAGCTDRKADRFVCPITERQCADAELIQGHILNDGIRSASKLTVIQYGAVDHFYGTRVEASLVEFLNIPKKKPADLLKHAKRIILRLADGSVMDGFFSGPNAATRFPRIDLMSDGKVVASPYVRTTRDDPRIGRGRIEAGFEVTFMPSHWVAGMVKSAYLTMFYHLGYKAMLDPFGEYIRQSLHSYYLDQASRQDADRYFYPFRNALNMMLRPDDGRPLTRFCDTLRDSVFLLHFTPAGLMFAATLFFEVNDVTATVTVPLSNQSDMEHCISSIRVYNALMEDHMLVEQYVRFATVREGKWHLDPAKRNIRYKEVAAGGGGS
jgi:hypothetical protein